MNNISRHSCLMSLRKIIHWSNLLRFFINFYSCAYQYNKYIASVLQILTPCLTHTEMLSNIPQDCSGITKIKEESSVYLLKSLSVYYIIIYVGNYLFLSSILNLLRLNYRYRNNPYCIENSHSRMYFYIIVQYSPIFIIALYNNYYHNIYNYKNICWCSETDLSPMIIMYKIQLKLKKIT